jgi:hypothetical protein
VEDRAERANAGLGQSNWTFRSSPGKVRPLSRPLTEAHPQILIIAPAFPSFRYSSYLCCFGPAHYWRPC